jgi:hypothetical protein
LKNSKSPSTGSDKGNQLEVVYLLWNDASHQEGQVKKEDFETKIVLHTAGILACENDETYSVAIDYNAKTGEYRDVTHIPKKMVTSMQKFKVE